MPLSLARRCSGCRINFSQLLIATRWTHETINNGIYTPGVTENKCGSGNCTYEPYSSVGYCARCEDISSQVHFTNISRLNTGRIGPSGGRSSSTSTIPGGIGIQFEQYRTGVAEGLVLQIVSCLLASGHTMLKLPTTFFTNVSQAKRCCLQPDLVRGLDIESTPLGERICP
jgi:hypothetical protein